jgi:hypothetical protein
MAHTGVVINKESWAILRDEPLYSARFIDREGTDELALVMRVEILDLFFEADSPLMLSVTTWQSTQEVWVVLVTYQLPSFLGKLQTGIFYLNPCDVMDAAVLRKLVSHEKLAVIFLSEDCEAHYTVTIPLDPQALTRGQECLAAIPIVNTDGNEAAFSAAVRELEANS